MQAVTPLAAFQAAERYIAATCIMTPSKLEGTSNAQMRNLIEMFQGMPIDVEQATELIEALNHPSECFNAEQLCSDDLLTGTVDAADEASPSTIDATVADIVAR